MKRSTFLKTGSLVAAPLLLNGVPVYANQGAGNPFFDFLAQNSYGCGKVLVIIQMNGGNDGLNTVIPIDRYDNLAKARPNLIIPKESILPLTGTINTGLHPAMKELRDLYNDGKMVIVQGVSYPNPNFSHFRATDIWFSGSASNVELETGWLGRSLDEQYDNYPAAFPNTDMADPLAIQIGSTLPFSLQGPKVNMGYNVPNPTSLLNVINATTDPAPSNDYGRELSFLRLMKDQSNSYTSRIQAAYTAQPTVSAKYPSGNSLADQLKIVARLIGGGLKTPVYIVNHPKSHDTHVDQVATLDKTTGYHADNLNILSKAVAAFQDDVQRMGKGENVLGMTFSEFGRRIINNASNGTDHGVGAPVMFFGATVKGGLIGNSPVIPDVATVSSQVDMQTDFRKLYSTVMQQWMCLSRSESSAVLGSDFETVPLFASNAPLPYEDITLSGQYYGDSAQLTFKVEDNTHYSHFLIEFSPDGVNYNAIQRISNTSMNGLENYSAKHVINAPKMFYRIAGHLLQGTVKYSNVVLLRANPSKQLISVYPNPVTSNHINVKMFESTNAPVDITIYDLLGAKVYYNRFTSTGTLIGFNVPSTFARNTHYIIEVKYGSTVAREQLIFQ